jgi:group I intron endonuclease
MQQSIKTGIYKITNPNGKVYIGQSIDIDKRWNKYKVKNCKPQIRLYNSLNKYGWENHYKDIIEECEVRIQDDFKPFQLIPGSKVKHKEEGIIGEIKFRKL